MTAIIHSCEISILKSNLETSIWGAFRFLTTAFNFCLTKEQPLLVSTQNAVFSIYSVTSDDGHNSFLRNIDIEIQFGNIHLGRVSISDNRLQLLLDERATVTGVHPKRCFLDLQCNQR